MAPRRTAQHGAHRPRRGCARASTRRRRDAAGHQQTAPSPERRERRADDQRRRFVDRVATAVTQLATRRGWERAVISGDERLTGPLLRALPEPLRDNAVRDPRHLIESDSRSLNAIVSQLLEQQQAESDLRLTERILNAARAAEGGALGLSEVLAALNEARVMHLIYDPDLRYAGAIADDGQLSSPPEQRPMDRVGRGAAADRAHGGAMPRDRSARDTRRRAGGGNAGRYGRGGRATALVAEPARLPPPLPRRVRGRPVARTWRGAAVRRRRGPRGRPRVPSWS